MTNRGLGARSPWPARLALLWAALALGGFLWTRVVGSASFLRLRDRAGGVAPGPR